MAKYYLNNLEFKNQKEAMNYVRDYLTALIGCEIDSRSGHWSFFEELVKRHPEYDSRKLGPGILLYRVGTNLKGDVELNLTWTDGTPVDISWVTCVKAKSKSAETNLRCAMRVAVNDQINSFKTKFHVGIICEECGLEIFDGDDWDVDHKIHFEKLVRDFLGKFKEYPKKFDDQPITNKATFKKSNEEFEKAWNKEHLSKAKLRFLHRKCNLKRKKYKN